MPLYLRRVDSGFLAAAGGGAVKDQGPKSRKLHYQHLSILRQWLSKQGWQYREGNPTSYSVIDVRYEGHWMGMYARESSKHHLRIDSRLFPLINQFFQSDDFKNRKRTEKAL